MVTNEKMKKNGMLKVVIPVILVIAKQVVENPTTNEYTVTFDANGGTIQGYGNSSKGTKQVKYGEAQGCSA